MFDEFIEENDLTRQFGALIRELRRANGLSQEDFADRCGVHRTYIGSIERGEKAVTIVTAQKLGRALGLNLAELFAQLQEGGDLP